MSENLLYRWHPINNRAIVRRLDAAFAHWYRTPYMAGNRVRGVGTDCREFIVALLDEMFRRPEPTTITRVSPDSGIHTNRLAAQALKEMLRAFPASIIHTQDVEPGDIVVSKGLCCQPTRLKHAMIVATRPGVFWHCNNFNHSSGVNCIPSTGVGEIVRIYRPHDKDQWA